MKFADALAAPGFGAIAEFKRRSPSAGDLRPDGDVAQVARAYERAGARAMSILVDERFAGAWDDLRAAREATSLPLLAKGFFAEADDLRTAAMAGADAVLLLLRDLDDATLRRADARRPRRSVSTRSSRLTTSRSCSRAVALDAPAIGINARDLSTFEIDRRAQLELLATAPRDRIDHRRVRDRDARPGCCGRARRRERDADRLDADARARPRRQARRAALAAARQGLRPHAPGGCRRRGRGGRRPRRFHPRQGEPAPHGRAARRARHRASRRRLRRRGARHGC